MSYRKAEVFIREVKAGLLIETKTEYLFIYEVEYLSLKETEPVSLTFPLRKEPYSSDNLFPFFDGLIPEGWHLGDLGQEDMDYISKMDPNDRMGLLLMSGCNTTGNISVRKL